MKPNEKKFYEIMKNNGFIKDESKEHLIPYGNEFDVFSLDKKPIKWPLTYKAFNNNIIVDKIFGYTLSELNDIINYAIEHGYIKDDK